ncbi:hypothetical protein [Streptomyces sp. NPDC001165]
MAVGSGVRRAEVGDRVAVT